MIEKLQIDPGFYIPCVLRAKIGVIHLLIWHIGGDPIYRIDHRTISVHSSTIGRHTHVILFVASSLPYFGKRYTKFSIIKDSVPSQAS